MPRLAFGTLVGARLIATGATRNWIFVFTFLGRAAESVTWTFTLKTPSVVGVPVMAPVDLLRPRPGGSTPPATLQAYGAVPANAGTEDECCTPTFAVAGSVLTVPKLTGVKLSCDRSVEPCAAIV